MKVFLIWAQDSNGVIGNGPDDLSTTWTSKEDLQRFMALTKKAGVLICGNTTFKTFPKGPLKGRLNVVITNNKELLAIPPTDNLMYTNLSPQKILETLSAKGFDEVAICGGAQIYKMFWEAGVVTDLIVTIEPVVITGKSLIKLDPNPLAQKSTYRMLLNQEINGSGTVFQHFQLP